MPTEVSEVPVTDTNHPDEPTGATYYTVKIGGQLLVDTYDYNSLVCVSRENKVNQTDSDGLYDIKWEKTGNTFAAGASYMSGSLKALFDIRDGNNGENFTGAASVEDSMHVRIDSPSINAIVGITMPEEGTLHINGRDYNYVGFTYEEDADGNITSYTFELKMHSARKSVQRWMASRRQSEARLTPWVFRIIWRR